MGGARLHPWREGCLRRRPRRVTRREPASGTADPCPMVCCDRCPSRHSAVVKLMSSAPTADRDLVFFLFSRFPLFSRPLSFGVSRRGSRATSRIGQRWDPTSCVNVKRLREKGTSLVCVCVLCDAKTAKDKVSFFLSNDLRTSPGGGVRNGYPKKPGRRLGAWAHVRVRASRPRSKAPSTPSTHFWCDTGCVRRHSIVYGRRKRTSPLTRIQRTYRRRSDCETHAAPSLGEISLALEKETKKQGCHKRQREVNKPPSVVVVVIPYVSSA